MSPLPRPEQIRDFGCFIDHFRNARARFRAFRSARSNSPRFSSSARSTTVANRLSVTGHEADVKWPAYSTVRDYELEFACILGRGGADIPREHAHDHIFGTPSSTTSVPGHPTRGDLDRSRAQQEQGLRQLKCAGPWIVTTDELDDPYRLQMVARINGEEVSRGTSADMHHTFADMITFASSSTQLYAGEVLCSGTVPTGCGLEHGRYLEPADVVELEVSGIGILRNRVMA
ncbi:fumarylacetoacetate hydrolase family protein [Rhodococcus hoagii]|nr:fumarylacetoacetate hydrolase family protein [Prescottella equi]